MDPVKPVETAPVVEAPKEPAKPEAVAQEPKKETVGDVLDPKPVEKKEDTVPLSTFLEMKKEMKQEIKDLKKTIEEGGTRKEIAADIKSLSEKHGVDAEFLQEFAQSVREGMKSENEELLKPMKEKEKAEKIDKAFNEHFSKALEEMPEFESIVNKEVIKTLSLNPANRNKTFTQIIEESYGHLVQGKRSIDSGSAGAGKSESGEVDMSRVKDPTYFKEVMGNPALKKKYNEAMMGRLTSHL